MFDDREFHGTTTDLIAVLRLTPMNAATRVATIVSVRRFRETLMQEGDPAVEELFHVCSTITPEQRESLGARQSQILSDLRRAERAWADSVRRSLALRLRGRLPTLADAIDAVDSVCKPEAAKRSVQAIRQLATSQASAPEQIVATSVVIEPMLHRLRPEDLQVQSAKSLVNKLSQIRAAVKLVDPNAVSGRESDVKALPEQWRMLLDKLATRTPPHAKSETAIFRRLALRADQQKLSPNEIDATFLAEFSAQEIASKSDSHREKLRRAGRIWNDVISEEKMSAAPFRPAGRQDRLPDVTWIAVPDAIRSRVDALTDKMVAPQGDLNWSSFIKEEDDELGLGELQDKAKTQPMLTREPGTQRNLRDAVKRVWHAAESDPAVRNKPKALEDLFRPECLLAAVAAIRGKRRARVEAQGQNWETHKKGRYECSVVQALYSVGKSCDLPGDLLEPVRALTMKLDPSVVGSKLKADGSLGYVYEERKIGRHHDEMLRQFNDDSALSRWFQAPKTLWREAERWVKHGKARPTLAQAGLARSALIAQLSQRVTPMRRTNFARLRAFGEQPHLSLPIGQGDGRMILPAAEMKNLRSVHVTIDPETVRMLKRYIEIYRPVLAENAEAHAENEHLFPGASTERKERGENGGYADGLGYMAKSKLCARFRQHVWKYCQLRMDMQVMRHIAGKVILDMDPSAMGLVQEVLGHKRIETTRAYYAEVSKIVAQKNYLKLLDQYSRRVLSHVDFRIVIEQQMEH
ncbi:tyrosine-type recombinase/integrase [Maliponia aquimaris]|uniref:Phage integrase family protein n=1 Tax=Maliponia aquimaris TaxID=1673631 RepID=A0A238L4B3_9RHOB|nr:tyrosine-type recombinase/integrase [Maliponia aquimaris]SMX49923.1 hypothetical protein MAA8898_04509 [Maliponia aquimaris]